jgi:hypothetical protein
MTPEQKTAEAARYKANKLKYGARIADTIRREAKITASMPKNPRPGAKDAKYYAGVAEKSPRIAELAKREAAITAAAAKKKAAKKKAAVPKKTPRLHVGRGGGMRGGMMGGSGAGLPDLNR